MTDFAAGALHDLNDAFGVAGHRARVAGSIFTWSRISSMTLAACAARSSRCANSVIAAVSTSDCKLDQFLHGGLRDAGKLDARTGDHPHRALERLERFGRPMCRVARRLDRVVADTRDLAVEGLRLLGDEFLHLGDHLADTPLA
jgi:hypothetical protein